MSQKYFKIIISKNGHPLPPTHEIHKKLWTQIYEQFNKFVNDNFQFENTRSKDDDSYVIHILKLDPTYADEITLIITNDNTINEDIKHFMLSFLKHTTNT